MPPPRKPQRTRTTGTPPVVLVKWYDVAKWLLERVDSFPKNQRFIFGQRIASDALDILALLVEASYRRDKVTLLENANRRLEVLRWLLRMAWCAHVSHAQSYGLRRSVPVRPRRRVIETKTRGSFRVRSSNQNNNNPTNENNNIGFRVASPGSAIDL